MTNSEMNKKIGIPNSTLTGWKNSKDNYKELLYEVLKALPSDFVEGVKKKLEEEEKLKNSLKG